MHCLDDAGWEDPALSALSVRDNASPQDNHA